MYADDMLLACFCFGLQQLVDICEQYGKQWDIIFNPQKTQCVTFGGKNPDKCCIILNSNKLEWMEKLTYLGCQFFSHSCKCRVLSLSDCKYSLSPLSQTQID